MDRIAEFEKVSIKEFQDTDLIKLPVRATIGSAGYDFFTPYEIRLKQGETALVKTGVRCKIAEGWALFIMPKSGLGFKYRLQLDNTIGLIDSDYYYAENEGHIMIKITNDNREGKDLVIEAGRAFAQGVFLPYGITISDNALGVRHGGFGSTNS